VLNQRARAVIAANGGTIVGEEYFPLDHDSYRGTVDRIMSSDAEIVFNTTVPPGVAPFLAQLHEAGFSDRGGQIITTYFDENMLGALPHEHTNGLYSCLDYYQAVSEPFSAQLLARYNKRFPGAQQFTGGSACSGLYRGIKFWEAAVKEAGSLEQADVVRALDHARIAEGPGGPAQMVPGQHHARMNMYIGRAKGGAFEIVQSLGVIDPQEGVRLAA
jgi:ABC-type branched-subunit amino acid transport system substrate-binding protein